uniref:Aminopeptidase P N-terminal domain-containing protein n=1 Tax=Schizophyllum commune (strain H4-8 / FGSC 9210) TaxID=578458 RepID=D8PL84_SCHCM
MLSRGLASRAAGSSVLRSALRRVDCRKQRLARWMATEAHQAADKPTKYGQPLYQSHPHLVQPGELTPGIPQEEYERRRKALMDSLPDNSVVVCAAAPIKYMSGDQPSYKYRQSSDFWYLTGFEEPDSAVILEKTSTSKGYRMTLFCSGKNLAQEKWDGAKTGLSEATAIFGADDARSIDHFNDHLRSLTPLYSNIYTDLDSPSQRRGRSRSGPKHLTLFNPAKNPLPLSPEVARLRAIKSDAEVRVMRAAADISARAHAKTMRFAKPGMNESQIAAHFAYLCAMSGAQRQAYVPVVASGPNALIIHYTSNNQLVRAGELVLIDAACEYNGYASDITRTFPASGVFSPAQRDIYQAVLSAQRELVKMCTASSGHSLYSIHRESRAMLRAELNQLPRFQLDLADVDILYPHFVSHPIGIDLHESSSFDRSGKLQAGMVITIEPGIYVPPTAQFPKHFHDIGVRIEDEVVVGERHPTVLTVSAPKEVADVEGACQGLLGLEPY